MNVDARILRGGVLALWAGFFIVLWTTGTSDRYLGSRTQWVVPFGAVVLTLATCCMRTSTRAVAATGRP
jgi:hypothetical protein